jgi:alkylation response protein AidB-like acyl-CoA dehydrogenase
VTPSESITEFTDRVAAWLAAGHLPSSTEQLKPRPPDGDAQERDRITECRRQQRVLYNAGLAGICVPREYGGLGLTMAHQDALTN